MTSAVKTVVATGMSSGLGLEALKQLLQAPQPYHVVLGARNTAGMHQSLKDIAFDSSNKVDVLQLDLADLKEAKSFAQATLEKIGDAKIDFLLLNAGISMPAVANSRGYKWCETAVVNVFSQHYIVQLLREKLVASKSRIVFVNSGASTSIKDPSILDESLKSGAGTEAFPIYSQTKFTQLLNAHWWRRDLTGVCDVVAVSPGMIPATGIGRDGNFTIPSDNPDAKTVPQGASNILAAFTRSDFPADPDQIFLTSWGEWWPKTVIERSLDKSLQDKWSVSREEIEKEAGISA